MKTAIVLMILLLSCNTVYSQQPAAGHCSTCSCGKLQLNVDKLQDLIQFIVNETLNETIQSIQQQMNASIDEKITLNTKEHQDINTPGY